MSVRTELLTYVNENLEFSINIQIDIEIMVIELFALCFMLYALAIWAVLKSLCSYVCMSWLSY